MPNIPQGLYRVSDKVASEVSQDGGPACANEISKIIDRLNLTRESVELLADRANRLDARLSGAPLLNDKREDSKPVPSGAIGAINERLNDITSRLSELRSTLDHLDTVA